VGCLLPWEEGEEQKRVLSLPIYSIRPSKKKESGRATPALVVSLLGELVFQPPLQFGFIRAELGRIDLIHELFQLVGGDVVPHRFLSPAEDLVRGCRPGDSPRLKGSERGSPPGQGGAPQAETKKQPASWRALKNGDLEQVGCSLP
jgi:hypothetical protein